MQIQMIPILFSKQYRSSTMTKSIFKIFVVNSDGIRTVCRFARRQSCKMMLIMVISAYELGRQSYHLFRYENEF